MKNLITYLKTLWGAWGNLQSKDVRHDCRLTVGSPSGMTAKLQVNSFMRFAVVLTLIFTIGSGNVWGADVTGTINFGSASGFLNINSASVSGDDDLSNSWTVTTAGTTSFTPNAAYAQVGSSKKPATSITFTTTLPSAQTITSMSAKFGGFSGTAGTVTLKVGDNSIGTSSLSGSSDVTVNSTDATKSGTVLTVTVTGISKGVKCYYISYTYSTSGGTTYYTVTYDANGGSGTMTDSDSPYSSGATVTVLDNEFTAPSGYVFDHWNTEDDDSGTDYDPDDTFTISANTTLYAQWVESGGGGGNEYVLTDLENIGPDDVVVIIGDNGDQYAMSNGNGTTNPPSAVGSGFTIDGTTLTTDETNILWNIDQTDGSISAIYPNGTTSTWLYCTNTNNGVRVGTNENKAFTIDAGYIKNTGTSRYVGIYNSQDWRCYTSSGGNIAGQTFSFYVLQDDCDDPATALSVSASPASIETGANTTLTASGGNGGTISWEIISANASTGSLTGSGATTRTFSATAVGTYTIKVSQAKNGDVCPQSATVNVTVTAAPINVTLNRNGVTETINNVAVGTALDDIDGTGAQGGCADWTFIGWSKTQRAAQDNSTAMTLVTEVDDAGPYYAVYSHTEGGGGGGAGSFTWNLTTNSYTTGTDEVTWSNTYATMHNEGTNATNYLGGDGNNRTSSRFYINNTLTITPSSGIAITSITFTATTEGYATTLANSTWTNATASASSTTVTITPTSGSSAVTSTIGGTCGFTSVQVNYTTGGSTTYYSTTASCGPKITATDGLWVTSTKDKRVKIEIPVEATNFASSTNLSYSIYGDGFSVVGWGANENSVSSSLSTSVIVQYQPTAAYNTTNDATLTISGTGASDAVVTIHGRSLPQKFVIASQINNTKKWKAVPANMTTAGEADGISVETDDNTNPTVVTENYTTAFYGLTEVATYATYGTAVRFSATTGGNMLWGATSGTNINDVTGADERNQEWILNTTDGVEYTLTNAKSSTTLKYFNSTNKFGMLDSGKEKLRFIAAGCDTPPTVGTVTNITSNSATISGWTPAGTVTIKLYSDAACTRDEVVYENVASSLNLTGLFGGYTYYYKIYAGVGCVSAVGSFTTEEGEDHMTVTEWQENAVVISFNGEDADLVLSTYKEEDTGEEEVKYAEDIFFSKYYEAASNVKLVGLFNGTDHDIDIASYKFALARNGGSFENTLFSSFKRYDNQTFNTTIHQGEELILIAYHDDDLSDATIIQCAIDNVNSGYANYVRISSPAIDFNGDDALALVNPSGDFIDLIGAGTKGGGAVKGTDYYACSESGASGGHCGPGEGSYFMDKPGGWYNLDGINYITNDSNYTLSTNRCLLIRKNRVVSGLDAVQKNTSTFVTLGGVYGEWKGLQMPGGSPATADGEGTQNSCDGFDNVGGFDYSDYYEQYTTLVKDQTFEDYRTEPFDGTYTIPVPGLINMACSNVRIDLADASNPETVLIRKDIQVPIMITSAQTTTDEIFRSNEKTPEICSTCDLVILNGATLTKAADDAANDVPAVRNLKVYEGGKLVVPSGTNYTVNTLALRRENDAISMADIKGSLTVSQANGVSMDLRTDPQEWHYFALPFDCNKADITFADGTPAVQGTDYLLRWYNGAYRAANKTGGWENYTGATLLKGHGYIIGLKGSGIIKKELHFPMANGVIAAEAADKEIGLLYAYGGDKTDAQLTPNHKGWNLIGNPYMMEYGHWADNAEGAVLPTGMLVENEGIYERNGNGVRYIVEPVANGRSGYTQTAIGSHNMKPFTAYFIQVGGASPSTPQSVTFQTSKRASIVQRREAAEPETDNLRPIWYGIELSAANAEKDNTTLLISDNFTDDYDMMDDLVKMRGSKYNDLSVTTAPVLASRNNAGEMAFNALPDNTAAVTGVPLNYYAAQAGTYTIAMDSRYNLTNIKEAWLFDSTTGQYNDLLQGNYSFTTDAGDNSTRFRLFVTVDRAKAPEVATGCDNLLDGQLSLIAIDRTLVLSGLTENADVYVYDMSGKLINGSHTQGGIWRATVPSQGVYFVRVNGISGQQTLRTIVK